MTQIVESLFGVSPERYQEQKDAALQKEALAYAQLDPYQRATAGIYAGARGLASGIGRMLGGEDPGMRRVTEQDQIIRSINLNDPETFGPAAQRAYQMGHTELAQKILLGADTAYQRQEATRQRAAQMQTRQQTAEAQALLPTLMREARPEQMVSTDTGVVDTIPAQAAGINPDIQRRLMGTAAGQALLKSFGDAQKAMQGEVVKYGEGDIGVRISPITGLPERVVTGPEKYRPPVILNAGQMAVPPNDPRLTGAGGLTAPAAAAVAKSEPPSVLEYQFAKTADGGSFIGTYQDFVKAKADATRAPAAVAAPQALPASVQEYEYAKTVPGGNFVGTYQDFVKAKADAARAPAPVVAPAALPASVAEYNFAKTLEGGGFVGTLTDFMQAKAEATRAPVPITAPQAQPASVLEYNFAKTKDGGGFVGTYQDFVQSKAEAGRAPVPITAPPAKVAEYEFAKTVAGGGYKGSYTQFLNLGKSEGGGSGPGGAAGTGTIKVVDPKNPTKTIIVTKERAVREGLTPAEAIEGLTPQMRQKLEASYPQATTSLRGYQNKTTLFIKDLEALRDSEGLDSVTGFAAGRAPGLTDAGRRTVALYDKVVAKGGFQSLQDMRDMSKTGGALGNVSDRENTQLKASFAAIDRKQNAADVRTALDDLIKELRGGLGRLQDAYDLTYEYKRGNAAPAAGGVDANNPLLRGK